jgi:Uma2 family endonuclease
MERSHAVRYTYSDFLSLPEESLGCHEIIDGELFVTPAPSMVHQSALLELCVLLREYLAVDPVGRVFMAPTDVEVSDDTVVEPDLFVVPRVPPPWPRAWSWSRGMLLAVEILSPGSARADRLDKRLLYQRLGLPEYWIIDLDARLVERWRPGDDRPEMLIEELRWAPTGADEPLVVHLGPYFRRAWGEE